MKRTTRTIIALAAWLLLSAAVWPVRADDSVGHEYQVKAAFVYNFLKFVDWPKAKVGDSNEPMIIAIIGNDVFENAFEVLEQKTVENRKVVVKYLQGIEELEKAGRKEPSKPHPEVETIRKSHLLFICPSEERHTTEILGWVKGHSVLTVADTKHFLEADGIINLLTEEEKVRFEVNLTAAKQAGLEIRSKLLRLAKRIYEPPPK